MAATPTHDSLPAARESTRSFGRETTSISVLIVEDDRDIRECIADALEVEGYSVALAGNGREALEKLRAGVRPELILLDLLMPVMSGWEFRHEQLADPLLSGIPVVVVSASVPGGLRPDRHLSKPFGVDELLEVVGDFAARR
jgi:two-component system response regulator MprA